MFTPLPSEAEGEVGRAMQRPGGGRADAEHQNVTRFPRVIGPPPILLRSIDPSRNKLREGLKRQ